MPRLRWQVAAGIAASSSIAIYFYITHRSAQLRAKNTLDLYYYHPFTVQSSRHISNDTVLLSFQASNLDSFRPVFARGAHLYVKDDSIQIIRPYTPILKEALTRFDTQGQNQDMANVFELAVKVYPDGQVSKMLGGLKRGDEVEFRGPMTSQHTLYPFEKETNLTMVWQSSWLLEDDSNLFIN
jgi:NAD(P)H-flavin reductase